MTDLNGIIEEIEGLLGSEGSRELATALLPILRRDGYVSFSAGGYTLLPTPDNDDCAAWNKLLADAEEAIVVERAGEEWPEGTVREYIQSHDENDETPEEQLLAMFRAVYGRSPEGRAERLDMWSHICAGVSHS